MPGLPNFRSIDGARMKIHVQRRHTAAAEILWKAIAADSADPIDNLSYHTENIARALALWEARGWDHGVNHVGAAIMRNVDSCMITAHMDNPMGKKDVEE